MTKVVVKYILRKKYITYIIRKLGVKKMTRIIKFSLFIISLTVLILSCEQKYDDFGIMNPGPPPDLDKITVSTILDSALITNSSKIINEDILFLGSHIDSPVDTIATASLMIDCNLSVLDTADNYTLVLPINSNEIEDFENKEISVYKILSSWTEYAEDSLDMIEREFLSTVTIDSATGELYNQGKKFVLNYDFTADTASIYESVRDSTFYGFMFEMSAGVDLFPLVEFYSSTRVTTIPVLTPRKYTTVILPDTTILDSAILNRDISLVHKKKEFLIDGELKLSQISGESVVFKFDYPLDIPEDATILSGWLTLDNANEDSIYGGIGEITLFEVLDSTWTVDQMIDSLVYDTGNPYITQSIDSVATKIRDIEPLLRKWLTEPESNFGFYLEASNRSSSVEKTLGYSSFRNIRFEITYVNPPE